MMHGPIYLFQFHLIWLNWPSFTHIHAGQRYRLRQVQGSPSVLRTLLCFQVAYIKKNILWYSDAAKGRVFLFGRIDEGSSRFPVPHQRSSRLDSGKSFSLECEEYRERVGDLMKQRDSQSVMTSSPSSPLIPICYSESLSSVRKLG